MSSDTLELEIKSPSINVYTEENDEEMTIYVKIRKKPLETKFNAVDDTQFIVEEDKVDDEKCKEDCLHCEYKDVE